MLDRKTKDWDASIELLEDKKKQAKYVWLLFYFIGLVSVMASSMLHAWFTVEIFVIGTGLALLILATWFLMIYNQYDLYLFLNHKKTKVKK